MKKLDGLHLVSLLVGIAVGYLVLPKVLHRTGA